MERDAVVVEVGLNEATMRDQNPNVAYTPRECADDALRCTDVGASVVHWHARDPTTGEQRLGDAELYGEAIDAMRTSDVIAYPTYPIDTPSLDDRLAHVWALHDRHGLEVAPVDIGSVSIVLWNAQTRVLVGGDMLRDRGVIANPLSFTLDALEQAYALEMVPTSVPPTWGYTDCFDPHGAERQIWRGGQHRDLV